MAIITMLVSGSARAVCAMTIILCLLDLSLGVREEKFYFGELCDLQQRIKNGCSKQITEFQTKNACVFGCSQDVECVGASIIGKSKLCFHHYTCGAVLECTKKELEHKYLSKNCAHGGLWNPSTQLCSCVNGWVGHQCLDLPSKCLELMTVGRYPNGNYGTHLTLKHIAIPTFSGQPIPVSCSVSFNGNSYYSNINPFRNFGNGRFGNRTWEEYKNGFFVDENNHWLGLKNWNFLSLAGYTDGYLYFSFGNMYRHYHQFQVQDEASGFAFSYQSTSVDYRSIGAWQVRIFDCFGPLQSSSFSTRDNDKDGVGSENCAERIGSGWWFSGTCSLDCNLLGEAPSAWDKITVDQQMKIRGTDQDILSSAAVSEPDNVGIEFYVNEP